MDVRAFVDALIRYPCVFLHMHYIMYVILSTCSDGLGRTGTFIAIWSLIEQMKAEGQIDVVGTIKSIRTQRPGAVPHMVGACDRLQNAQFTISYILVS